jgi:hypothetical protein
VMNNLVARLVRPTLNPATCTHMPLWLFHSILLAVLLFAFIGLAAGAHPAP